MISLFAKARAWLVAAAVGLVVLVLALPVAGRFDASVAASLAGPGEFALDVSLVLAQVGDAAVVIPVALVLGGYFAWRKRYWLAARVVVLLGGGEAAAFVVKELVRKPRPPNPYETGYGFPSGHATAATIVACLLAWYALSTARPRARVVAFFALGIAWALVVSWSRLVLGVHRFSDIIGGVGTGLVVAGVGLAAASVLQRQYES